MDKLQCKLLIAKVNANYYRYYFKVNNILQLYYVRGKKNS